MKCNYGMKMTTMQLQRSSDLLITVRLGDESIDTWENTKRLKITATDPLDAVEAAKMVAAAVTSMRRERANG